MEIRIAINGFGRIGRQITRLLLTSRSANLKLQAINTLETIEQAAHLLKYDSNHGIFAPQIQIDGNRICVAGNEVEFFNESDPARLPWDKHQIDIILECSGQFTERTKAQRHLSAGAKKVLITAAAVNPDITLCIGANHHEYNDLQHHIISGSSCTTNAVAPVLKLINDTLGIKSCMATFLHSYTNSQNLLDTCGTDLRRARAAGLNILPTSTSATHQIPLIIPALIDKFDGLAIRVPTPNVHLADVTAITEIPTSHDAMHALLENSAHEFLKGIVKVTHEPLVSRDIKNCRHSSIVDAQCTTVNDNMIKLLIWHDNEYSYCNRMIDLASHIACYLVTMHESPIFTRSDRPAHLNITRQPTTNLSENRYFGSNRVICKKLPQAYG